ATMTAGSLIVNDDGFDGASWPAVILSPTDGVVQGFQQGVPCSERLDICHSGRRLLVAQSVGVDSGTTQVFDLAFTHLATLPYNTTAMALANNRTNRLYLGTTANPATIIRTDLDGTI